MQWESLAYFLFQETGAKRSFSVRTKNLISFAFHTVKSRLFEVPGTAGILSNNR